MNTFAKTELTPVRMPIRDVDGDGVIRVACVGDSITAGTPNSNYPAFLQQYLTALGRKDGLVYEVKNHGKGGAAVHHVEEPVGPVAWENVTDDNGDGRAYFYYDDIAFRSSQTYTPDVVIIQFGTNDGAGGNLDLASQYFKDDYYNFLVKPFLDKGSFVVVATPPCAYNGIHDAGVNGKISDLVRELAAEHDLPLIDVNRLTSERAESFPDGLHGNDSGYSLLAQIYYSKIFGGDLIRVKLHSNPGALLSFGIHNVTADSNGDGFVTLPAFEAGREVALRAVCDGFRMIERTETVAADAVYDCVLTQRQVNLAVGCTATADCAIGDNTADKAVDGDKKTRWESEYRDGCFITVDLGEVKRFNAVNIFWEGAYANHYTIDVSADGETFTTAADVRIDRSGFAPTLLAETEARFVRISCISRGTWYGNSIYELQVLTDAE